MAKNPKNWNDTNPAAPALSKNCKYQAVAPDPDPNVVRDASSYMPYATATVAGLVPTPPNDTTKWLRGDATWQTVPITYTYAALTDVVLTALADKDISIYDSATSKWKNRAVSGDVSMTGTGAFTVTKIQSTAVLAGMTPADGDVLTWDNSNSRWRNLAISALGGANASQIRSVNVTSVAPSKRLHLEHDGTDLKYFPPEKGHRGFLYAYGNGPGQSNATYGMQSTWGNSAQQASSGTSSSINAASGVPAYQKLTTGAAASLNACGWQDQTTLGTTITDSVGYAGWGILLGQLTNTRCWLGFSPGATVSDTTLFAGDTPNTSIIGFRYSAGSANWFAVCATSNVNITATDTGIAADTAFHTFEYIYDGTSVRFFIDKVLVATITTNIPTATTSMNQFIRFDNKNTANNQFLGLTHAWYSDRKY